MAKNSNSGAGGIGLPPGTKIGKYEVRERIGAGGQALVYKCHDDLLDRDVAVKQISPHLAADPGFMDRFRAEARILARLGAEQGAIVNIHELIEDERGLFIVMEYVPGHTLETLLRENPSPADPKAALQILWRLAAALNAVHKAGIVHRDIKPANIIVGEGLRAKITDFGVAASTSAQASMPLGTTKYMAPELYEGENIDGRCDQYSLGFILYEMAIGRDKFNEVFQDVVRDPQSEVVRWMKWHGNRAVKAPMAHEVVPSVPRPLSEIIARMIAKDPADRFESMEMLGREIKTTFARGRAAGRSASAAAAASSDTAGGLEADDLEIVPPPRERKRPSSAEQPDEQMTEPASGEGPATAPIPRKKLSRQTKLIAVGVLGGLLLIGAVVLLVMAEKDRARRQRERTDTYEAALATFNDSLPTVNSEPGFRQALEKFEHVRQAYPGTVEASKASVMVPLTKAYLAAINHDWDAAYARQSDALTARGKVQEFWTDRSGWKEDDLKKWLADRKDEIDDRLGAYLITARQFADAMAHADVLTEVVATIDAAREEARTKSPAEVAQLVKAARARVQETLRKAQAGGASVEALQKADETLSLTETRLLSPDPITAEGMQDELHLAKSSVVSQARQLLDMQENQIDLLTTQQRQRVASYKAAVEGEETEIAEYRRQRADIARLELKRRHEETIAQFIRNVDNRLAKAKEYAAAGKTDDARKQIDTAKVLHSALMDTRLPQDVSQADAEELRRKQSDAVSKVNAAIQEAAGYVEVAETNQKKIKAFEDAVKLADQARVEGDPAGEFARLQEAAEAYPQWREKIADRMNAVRTTADIARAKSQMAAGGYSNARGILEDVLQREPDNKTAKALLQECKDYAEWGRLFAEGRDALQKGDAARAKELLSQAMKIRKTDEVARLLDEASFQVTMAEADTLYDQGDYEGAQKRYNALYKIAAEKKHVVDAKIARVERKISFNDKVAAGDEALQKARYTDARKRFEEALRLYKPGDDEYVQADAKLARANYMSYRTLGDTSMEQGGAPAALAYYKNAQQYARTAEEKAEIADRIKRAEAVAGITD